jgi:hypothetical protein
LKKRYNTSNLAVFNELAKTFNGMQLTGSIPEHDDVDDKGGEILDGADASCPVPMVEHQQHDANLVVHGHSLGFGLVDNRSIHFTLTLNLAILVVKNDFFRRRDVIVSGCVKDELL